METALAPAARVDDLELDSGDIGYAPKALGAVPWASRHPGSVGARFGLGGIPGGWRARVAEIRAWEAPVNGWVERRPLEEYAARLLALPGVGHG